MRLVGILLWVGASASLCAQAADPPFAALSLDQWIAWETPIAEAGIEANLSASGAAQGAVIASPQQANPDYFYHWVRDSALTMDVVRQEALQAGSDISARERWEAHLRDYAVFSRANQLTSTLTGLGEPKFLVNGAAFSAPWGRPQNDGAALRASALARWAETLLDRGETAYVHDWLYNSDYPADSLVKQDLEYVAAHWQDPSFDLWEEVQADHFYTRMVQWKALSEGAELASRLGDNGAAAWYTLQAKQLAGGLTEFYAGDQVNASANYVSGANYKDSQLDIAVILAMLHADGGPLDFSDARVQATFHKLEAGFASLYPINQRAGIPGSALGRYPEDRYSGGSSAQGNPWVLSTLAGAEYNYRLARDAAAFGRRPALALAGAGDLFLERLKYHADPDGSFSEQLDRDTGFMTSAHDLTWSYSAFLTAVWARDTALGNFPSLSKPKEHK